MEESGRLLIFPTTVDGKSYLNVSGGTNEQIKLVEEKGWSPETINAYLLFKYQVKDDELLIQETDDEAKERTIREGKIKGIIERGRVKKVMFTDTTEHLAKFVAEAGDDLFSKHVVRLERVK